MAKRADVIWEVKLDHTRKGVVEALNAIGNGSISEDQFEKLNNFCQFALALMQVAGPVKWSTAKMQAEMMALIHAGK